MTTEQVDLTDIRKRIERQFDQGYIASGTADLLQLMVNHLEAREAWEKNREATEALLLRMLEKLTPAAETEIEVTPCICVCHGCMGPKATFSCDHCHPETTATPQPACRHPWEHLPTQRLVMGSAYEWCGHCGALWDGSTWLLPTTPAPQQTEG